MLMLAAKKATTAPFPTECPFINEIVALVLAWVAG